MTTCNSTTQWLARCRDVVQHPCMCARPMTMCIADCVTYLAFITPSLHSNNICWRNFCCCLLMYMWLQMLPTTCIVLKHWCLSFIHSNTFTQWSPSVSHVQVLLEASDLAGISVFLAMLVACTVAIILLPIETKGKSLRVSQCVYCRKVYVHIYVHDPCLYCAISVLFAI